MRQLLSILPPRMVSRKWTCQLSSGHTLPMAAAMPPSAMTVWALPRSDLQTRPTLTPCAAASIAARSPAPPAPMTMTSCSCVSYVGLAISASSAGASERDPQVADDAHRYQPDVDVGEPDAEERQPREHRVLLVQARDAVPQRVPRRRLREDVDVAAADVPAGVAGEGVAREEDHVDPHDHRADADPERRTSARRRE